MVKIEGYGRGDLLPQKLAPGGGIVSVGGVRVYNFGFSCFGFPQNWYIFKGKLLIKLQVLRASGSRGYVLKFFNLWRTSKTHFGGQLGTGVAAKSGKFGKFNYC